MSTQTLWMLFLLMGLITVALRGSFIVLQDRLSLPPLIRRALTYVPQAVLAAIVAPALFSSSDVTLIGFDVRLPAAALALVVATRTKNVLATLGVGMGVLWILTAVAQRAS